MRFSILSLVITIPGLTLIGAVPLTSICSKNVTECLLPSSYRSDSVPSITSLSVSMAADIPAQTKSCTHTRSSLPNKITNTATTVLSQTRSVTVVVTTNSEDMSWPPPPPQLHVLEEVPQVTGFVEDIELESRTNHASKGYRMALFPVFVPPI
ncbi:hypothetical protein TWF481_007832 [Arthrobotrys musiformis]|uniref:Uncharacterized protein n=1 Tax=Arthrobotrys musiformis TaxID=47236 RepID=A0AAV9W5C7_9PEZI